MKNQIFKKEIVPGIYWTSDIPFEIGEERDNNEPAKEIGEERDNNEPAKEIGEKLYKEIPKEIG